MIFKKIEMIGFKSFADRTVIEFDDNFTAIVGPNGCGKSNVSDAIRWVLGEQSPKSLRGDSMQDVIFNGTEKRKSLSYCEVTLTFDNTTRFFDFDYDELAITRKLYRSGESEYLINRNTCHLRDIVNLLYNSGLGKNGYSVIGQGKVTEIVDSKPENRRAMFEDAAGISKYKNDKRDAERKLERTRDNLTRVNDILAEIERQLGPMKKQAENAKKYLAFKDELKDLEVNAYVYQYENATDIKEKINQKLSGILQQLAVRQDELDTASNNYNKSMNDLTNFDKMLAALNESILEMTVALEKQEGETKIARERINYTNKENDRLHLDRTNSLTAMEIATEQREAKLLQQEKLTDDLSALEKSCDELSESYSALANKLTVSETEAGQSQQKFIETLGSLSDVKSNASRLAAEKEILSTNLASLKEDISALTAKRTGLEDEVNTLSNNVKNLTAKLEGVKQNLGTLTTEAFLQEKALKEFEIDKANKVTQLKVYENRKKLLHDLQTEYEGYSHAVKKLLKESEHNMALKNKIVGVVASLIKVPEKFETAIEVALGGAVQNIVTFDEEGAKSLISFLKENQYGRATFLPISSMKRRDIDGKVYAGKAGFMGVASEIVSYDHSIDNVVSNLLGATVIADNLYHAVEMAKATGYSCRIVTLDGDVVNPAGSLTGGSKKMEAANLMGRAREIETLGKEIVALQSALTSLEEQIRTSQKGLADKKSQIESLNREKNAFEVELATETEKSNRSASALCELDDNIKVSKMEAESVENKLALVEDDLSKTQKMESALSGNSVDADELIRQKREANAQLRKERDDIADKLSLVRMEMVSKRAQLAAVQSENERLTNEIEKQKVNLVNIDSEIERNTQFVEQAEQMIKAKLASAPSSKQKEQLTNALAQRANIENDKLALSQNIKKLDEEKTSIMEEIARVNDKKFREEMNLAKVDTELETMQERIYEEYSMVYNDCLECRRPDFDINEAMPHINKLKKDISALGYVNVNAIEDSKVLLGRYEELSTQCEDLHKAEDDLNKIIKDLSSIMIEKFMNELDKINESFKLTFRELFGGGTAKLALSDENDPLESGVEIFAQPPGKKIQNMTLLSGGEKSLTAMAVIFAILRIKPLPFCLFDEVEAALDDSNVEIVDKYLKKLSSITQFILITHKKPTMEYANSLFGVTMEEKGVSKIVSVKLADAIKNAQEG